MITERAKSGFDTLLQSALKSGLSSAGGPCRIERVEALGAKIKQKKIVVLTVSSYLFRLLAILYFKDDAATRAFFANKGGGDGQTVTLDAQEFLDRVGECGNMICGALNRDLGRHFPHVGMSTPNVIDRDCMRYVDLLGCGLLRHYRIDLPDGLEMCASLCVSDYGTVDFHQEAVEEAEDQTVGELEMF